MKSFKVNTKWVLTASLLTVLAAQNASQFSSLKSNSSSGVLSLSSEKESSVTTEALAGSNYCSTEECSISVSEFNNLMTKIASLEKMFNDLAQQKATPTAPPAPVATTIDQTFVDFDSMCEPASAQETRQERKDRLQCEKEERQKAKEEALVERFEQKMERLQDKCDSDTACLTEGFSNELARYTGKKSLPAKTIVNAFKTMVIQPLDKNLFTQNADDLTSSTSAIQALIQTLPEQYNSLKKNLLDRVNFKAQESARQVSQGYQNLKTLEKQNNPEAYLQAVQEVEVQKNEYIYLTQSYTSAIQESITSNQDMSLLDYYKKSYLPQIQKTTYSIYPSNTSESTTRTQRDNTSSSQPTTNPVNPSVENSTRNLRTSESTTSQSGLTHGKLTRDSEAWPIPPDLTGIQQNGSLRDKALYFRQGRNL